MGNTQTINSISQQYEIVQVIHSNRKLIRRKKDRELCQLLTLPVYGQQKYQLIDRLKIRLGAERPMLMTPLLSWHRKEQPNLCGNKEQIQLVFGETTPTLQEVFRYRSQRGVEFSTAQILYVMKNVALALKNFQKINEQHGKVNLSNICVRNDVLLMDSLLFQKRVNLQMKNQDIQGYPSPQKLRSLYDSLSNFEELRGDLFSLGMVCLQLYYIHFDVKALYGILDPRFSNYRLNLQQLNSLCSQVKEPQLRQALLILTSLNSKDRLNIYAFFKNLVIDAQQVRLFEDQISLTKTSNNSQPLQNYVKPSGLSNGLVRKDSVKVNATVKIQEKPRETVQSFTNYTSTNPPVSHISHPSISFRIAPNQQPVYHHLPQHIQPSPMVYNSSTFKPLKFTLLDNVASLQHSQYINTLNSTLPGNSALPSAVLNFSTFVEQSNQRRDLVNQASKTQRLTPVKAEVKIINLQSLKKQNTIGKEQQKGVSAQEKKQQDGESNDKSANQPVRTQSIYHQEPRPLAFQPTQTLQTPQKEQSLNNLTFSEPNTQQQEIINTIPVSNSYPLEPQKIQSLEFKDQSPSLTQNQPQNPPVQINAQSKPILRINTDQQTKENSAHNPQDKIQFVIQQYGIGTRYQGGKLNGMRHGKGKFFYKEGSYYDGEWKNNKMHGLGILYYPNGSIAYQGEWKDDEFDGAGIVYNDQQTKLQGTFDFTDFNKLDEEWIKYEGELKNDAKEGRGRLFLTNGQVYEGQFLKDTVHGTGVFKSGKNERRGIWQFGKLKKLL